MQKISGIILLLIFVGLLFSACESDSCLHGTGDEISMPVNTGYFDELEVNGIFKVVLVEDTAVFAEFKGGDKVLEYVQAVVTDSCLRLSNSNSCYYLRDYKKIIAEVHYTKLNTVILNETCKLESQGSLSHLKYVKVQGEMAEIDIELEAEVFNFYNHTTTGGYYIFKGYVERCNISNYYTAKCDMSQLTARNLSVNNFSLADLYVNAEESLKVKIMNKGNIFYSGSPEIIIDSIDGSGQLLPWVQ